MLTKQEKERADMLLFTSSRLLNQIQTPRLFQRGLAEASKFAHLVVLGFWPEGYVHRWKDGNWLSGEPVEKRDVEDGDLDMSYGCLTAYLRALRTIDRQSRNMPTRPGLAGTKK